MKIFTNILNLKNMRTTKPGVYIDEKNAFPNSVVQVATAVPVFIGHTKKAEKEGETLLNKPIKINSMDEYANYFGEAADPKFKLKAKEVTEGNNIRENKNFSLDNFTIEQSNTKYNMYFNMLLFYQNGGGSCYIISIGDYKTDYETDKFLKGIDLLVKEQEPTILVIPELINLGFDDCIAIQQHSLAHCGEMRSRVSILDIFNGDKDRNDPDAGDVVNNFREGIGANNLGFAAAYYPWVNTSVINDNILSFLNIDTKSFEGFKQILNNELITPIDKAIAELDTEKNKDAIAKLQDNKTKITNLIDSVKLDYDLSDSGSLSKFNNVNKSIIKLSSAFSMILNEIKAQLNLLPTSAAMAGIYTMVDNSRGVWKAPANVSLNSVVSLSVNITHSDQEDLNVPLNGKSVNVIRSFVGEGVLVWGARTLDGNSSDWRYISVRRTIIMLEQSIKIAAKAYVFEPNAANTWVTIKSMIRNFLTGIWKQGGLAGASPADAFGVHVGLGETMTSEDILEGVMRITVLAAVTRPAEFIEITFLQQMQKS